MDGNHLWKWWGLLLLPFLHDPIPSPFVVPSEFNRKVHIIAHRGAPIIAPENTLISFRKAVKLGATMIELDVHQTADSQLVVLHDETVHRTTNGRGKVGTLTADQIRALDAGSWFSSDFAGERVPFLAEVLDQFPDSIMLLVEIKYGSKVYLGIEQRVVNLIRSRYAERRVILKSFEDYVIETLAHIAPEIPRLKIFVWQIPYVGITIERGIGFGSVLNTPAEYLQVFRTGMSESFLRRAQEKGYKVFVWGVHTEERMREYIEMGVDGIETDYPDVLLRVLSDRMN